jgi:hypothetical protein
MEAGPDPAANNSIVITFILSNLIKELKIFLSIIQGEIIDTQLWKILSKTHRIYNKFLVFLNDKDILMAGITPIFKFNVSFFWTNLIAKYKKQIL